jgi:hypothetical protein
VRASSCCCCCCCSWLGTAEETVLLSTPSFLKNQLGPNPPCYTVLAQLQDVSRERGRVPAGRTRGCVRRWLTHRKGCPPTHHLCPGGGRGRGDSMLHISHLCPFTPYGVGGGGRERGGEVWLAGKQGARETRLTPSKETCRLSKETCRLSKETCRLSKETCRLSKETCRLSKETCRLSKETCRLSKETCRLSKETCRRQTKVYCFLPIYFLYVVNCWETAPFPRVHI